MTTNKNDERYRWARQSGLLSTIPFLLAVPPVAGVLFGKWLDGRLGTLPLFTVLFVIFGFVAGIREVKSVLKKAELDSKKDTNNSKTGKPDQK